MKIRCVKYAVILLGAFFLAFSIEVFLVPSKLSSGGISTFGTILYYGLGISLSTTNFFINLFLFVFGYRILGLKSVLNSIAGVLLFTVLLELCSVFPDFPGDILASAVLGGVFMGIGIGLVVRFEGSTGGSDYLGYIIRKFFPHLSVPNIIFFIDIVIIIFSGLYFKSLTIIVYSAIALFLSAKIGDAVLYIGNAAKQIVIISPRYDVIVYNIMKFHNRGATGIYMRGMYSDTDGMMIMCVTSPKEIPHIVKMVRNIDQSAFIVINDVKEVIGLGFGENKSAKK